MKNKDHKFLIDNENFAVRVTIDEDGDKPLNGVNYFDIQIFINGEYFKRLPIQGEHKLSGKTV